MALGALDTMSRSALERWYYRVVAGLADRERVLVVAEEEGQLARGRGIGRSLMANVEQVADEYHVTLLWLTTHADTEACAFYEAVGYTRLGTMPNYSRRPDGTLWPGAFYFKELSA